MSQDMNQDARLKKSADAGHTSRGSVDASRQNTDGTVYTVEERRGRLCFDVELRLPQILRWIAS